MTNPPIELAPGAEQNAFALMMAELIRANLADHPEKLRAFRALRGRVALVAEDAGTSVTLYFRAGQLRVYPGLYGIPDLLVRGPSEALIDFSRVPNHRRLRFLPDLRSPVVHGLARATYQRKLRINGLTSHPRLGLGLARVLSIYGEVSLEIEHRHSFSQEEARSRMNALGDYLSARHGMQVQRADEASFHVRGKYAVVEIEIKVEVHPDRVAVRGPDPGMLWRAPAKKYIERKLGQYLDPSQPLDALRRA